MHIIPLYIPLIRGKCEEQSSRESEELHGVSISVDTELTHLTCVSKHCNCNVRLPFRV